MNSVMQAEPRMRGGRWIAAIQAGHFFWPLLFAPLLTLAVVAGWRLWRDVAIVPITAETPRRFQMLLGSPARNASQDTGADADGAQAADPAAGAAQVGDPDILNAYLARVVALVDRAKRYPRREREDRAQGMVVVRVGVDRSGALTGVQLLSPSSREGFNREALEAVRRAAPFPAMPAEIAGDSVQLRLQLRFVLR
jgi:TonB family protein